MLELVFYMKGAIETAFIERLWQNKCTSL